MGSSDNASDVLSESRIDQVRSEDPGDQSERNFRYQHQYGVIILAAVRRGSLDYVRVYCEHHEDLLCEARSGLFDGWQIKTSTPENGPWKLTDDALVRSIGRFVDLLTTYSTQIERFFFVSNADVDKVGDDVKDQKRRGRCPNLMLEHIRSRASLADLKAPFLEAFNALAGTLAADRQTLFDVLQRLEILKGPSRSEFDASLAHEHLGSLDECKALNATQLSDLRDDLVARVHRAASLQVTDPVRHIRSVFTKDVEDPVIAGKRITCADVVFTPPAVPMKQPQYLGTPTLVPGGPRLAGVLEQKLKAGGLEGAIGYMTAKERAAEYALLEEQARDPATAERQLLQVEEAVHGECIEAYYGAEKPDGEFGGAMLSDINARLRRLETDRRTLLGGHPYEVLVGVAAMLTRACRVWWSKRFVVEEERP
ncbi:hypothetical protein CSW58_05570 [Caulobacter sp. B11]|uniref:dsDNA nuclease domain-containing protein n=1 Tax=Caulobacter sp. B11 TaxID=2048899 RepID=UPI000C12AE1C|nr:dsDNA nuclease domain-containing protein [Caulobacter sp. B11]PHY13463.1 hypothetical protein CSW58_05570 [Caulobacter sp. B11]